MIQYLHLKNVEGDAKSHYGEHTLMKQHQTFVKGATQPFIGFYMRRKLVGGRPYILMGILETLEIIRGKSFLPHIYVHPKIVSNINRKVKALCVISYHFLFIVNKNKMSIINFGIALEIKMLPNFLTIGLPTIRRLKTLNERASPHIIPINFNRLKICHKQIRKKGNQDRLLS